MELSDLIEKLPHGAIQEIVEISGLSRAWVSKFLSDTETKEVSKEAQIKIIESIAVYWERNKKRLHEVEKQKKESVARLSQLLNSSAPHCE